MEGKGRPGRLSEVPSEVMLQPLDPHKPWVKGATHTKAWGWGLGEQGGGAAPGLHAPRCTPTACFIYRDPTRKPCPGSLLQGPKELVPRTRIPSVSRPSAHSLARPQGVPWGYPPLGYPTCHAFMSSPLPKPTLQGPFCVCPLLPAGPPSLAHAELCTA